MKKSYLWRKMTSGLMAAAVTVTAMPGLGLTMVQAEEKKTLKVAMECSYAPYNWTQPDDSNGAVPINDSNEYAYGYDVMMAKKICDELGYDLQIVRLDWDSLIPAVSTGQVDCVIAGQSITTERLQAVDFTEPYYYATIVTLVKNGSKYADAKSVADWLVQPVLPSRAPSGMIPAFHRSRMQIS